MRDALRTTRGGPSTEDPAAGAASLFDRAQEFLAPNMRHHPIALEVTTGLRADGTIVGRQARMTLDTGAYCGQGPFIAEIATFVAAGPYRIPHLDIGLVSPGPSRAATTPSAGRA